jgi:hypothetical protein
VDNYAAKKARLAAQVKALNARGIGIRKDTSNLFRRRQDASHHKIDVRDFNRVLCVNPAEGRVEVEGMTPYATLVDATLMHGTMPCVVPQLKSITIGGAVSGLGIESSSFRHGLVHETIDEMDVLLATGDVVTCTPDNEHRDLFHGLPNSYGTLGYILKLKARTMPVTGQVRLRHHRHDRPSGFFADLAAKCGSDADFVDGVIFGPHEFYVSEAHHVASAPATSDYTFEHIYYKSIREKSEDFLATHDYIWRWDTDCWCSKPRHANLLVRRRRQLGDLHEDHALERPAQLDRQARPAARTAQRVGDPGHLHSDPACRGVPALPGGVDRHLPDLDLPGPPRETHGADAAVPDERKCALRRLRLLGRDQDPRGARARPFQPAHRTENVGTRGRQIPVLGVVLRPRSVLVDHNERTTGR